MCLLLKAIRKMQVTYVLEGTFTQLYDMEKNFAIQR